MTTNLEETFLDVTARAVLTGFLSSGKLPEFNPKSLDSLPEMSYLLARKMWQIRSTYVSTPVSDDLATPAENTSVKAQVEQVTKPLVDLSLVGTETTLTAPLVVKKKMGRPPKAKVAPVAAVQAVNKVLQEKVEAAPAAVATTEKPAKRKWTRRANVETVAPVVAAAAVPTEKPAKRKWTRRAGVETAAPVVATPVAAAPVAPASVATAPVDKNVVVVEKFVVGAVKGKRGRKPKTTEGQTPSVHAKKSVAPETLSLD